MDILIDHLLSRQTGLAIPGYFVRSTALLNVEDLQDPQQMIDQTRPTIQDIVDRLYLNHSKGQQDSGVVIAIHGYNTGSAGKDDEEIWQGWYQPLCTYANDDDRFINQRNDRFIFLGYRWPSESLKQKRIFADALKALPVILKVLFVGGLILTIVSIVALILSPAWIWNVLLILGLFGFSLIFCLYALRISVYFRDTYRATYFGVNDLVELIRQLDQGLVQRKMEEQLTESVLYAQLTSESPELQRIEPASLLKATQRIRQELSKRPDLITEIENEQFQTFLNKLQRFPEIGPVVAAQFLPVLISRLISVEEQAREKAENYWKHQPIQLSFIGHSMGAHVTTQTIRILSDVFDPRSIGVIGADQSEKLPSSRIGHVFALARLVLVSPDIPLLAITSGRSNFLRSSLRRFEEAYLFSNEGDLALRLASTAANYFSFPARTRTQGYRLGNVTVRKRRNVANSFGIVNLDETNSIPMEHLLPYLEVNVLNQGRSQTLDPEAQRNARRELNEEAVTAGEADVDKQALADLFTYFDCTEYRDYSDHNDASRKALHKIMILDGQRSPLRLISYIRLFIAYAFGVPQSRDVHGGYFWGRFSKVLLYRLVFLGFAGLLDSLIDSTPEELGVQDLPEELRAKLEQVRSLSSIANASTDTIVEQRRRIALRYLSWLCQQKLIQAAVSPERYQVDVLGRDQDDVRESMLIRQKWTEPQ